ncbi:MAG: hypothetical protein II994_01515, partial [Lachnospiraceae bacterium]|nr:hypothetical protein [Lachnospiraceae bacterium]
MTEELKEKQAQDYQFINEKIVPKRKKKWLKRLGTVVFVICMAIVFGVVAHAAYLLSGDYLKEWLGIEEKRQEVNLVKPSIPPRITLSPTPKPLKTPTPVPTLELEQTVTPTGEPEKLTPTAEPTPSPTPSPTPVQSIGDKENPGEEE